MKEVNCLRSPCLLIGMFPRYARELIQKGRPWILQCHALMQMMLGVTMRITKKKKSGGYRKWLFCFQSNDFQSKGILSLKMQTSFTFWSVQFVKLSDPRSEGTCICIDLALLIHLRLNLWIPFYDGGILMTIKPISHNTSNIYTALRQFLSELSPETLRDRSGLLTPFCTQRGSNLLNVTW